jgi:hypothetical protein
MQFVIVGKEFWSARMPPPSAAVLLTMVQFVIAGDEVSQSIPPLWYVAELPRMKQLKIFGSE